MKGMSKDPQAAEKARRAERARDKEAGLVKLDMSAASAAAAKPSGFKKGGFKSAFGDAKKAEDAAAAAAPAAAKGGFKKAFGGPAEEKKPEAKVEVKVPAAVGGAAEYDSGYDDDETDSDEDLGYEKYDPAHPTGCRDTGCNCRTNVIPQSIFPE